MDYSPFGVTLSGRGVSGSYRYSFQNQEVDNEIKGNGNSVNYKYRMHDPRVGRFFAVDPLVYKYPYLTPYQFSSNQLIHAKELEGLETSNDLNSRDPSFQRLDDEGKQRVLHYQGVVCLVTSACILYWLAPVAVVEFASIGSTAGGFYSAVKSKGDPYETLKGFVSGGLAGATLAFGPASLTVLGVPNLIASGAASGFMGEVVNQQFDILFGKEGKYDLDKLIVSSGVGAVANILTPAVIQGITKYVNIAVNKAIAETKTKAFRNQVAKKLAEDNPEMKTSGKAFKEMVNKTIKKRQNEILQDGKKLEKDLDEMVQKTMLVIFKKIEDQINEKAKPKN